MRKSIRNILLAGMVVLWTMPAWCEYYQYRDDNGTLRFTDDLSSVPPDQRPGVTTHQSVQSQPFSQRKGVVAEKGASRPQVSAKQEALTSGDTWEGKKARMLSEFDSKQAELNQTYTSLQAEQADLKANAPSKRASFEEKAVYNQKVAALNAKIDRYEEEMAAFSQQVNEYNVQFKKQ